MPREEIEITIEPDGQVAYIIKGIQGASCEDVSSLLEQLGEIEHEERTAEYYEEGDDAHISIDA